MTLRVVILIAYACRRLAIWIGFRMIALAVGFVVGWEAMKRR